MKWRQTQRTKFKKQVVVKKELLDLARALQKETPQTAGPYFNIKVVITNQGYGIPYGSPVSENEKIVIIADLPIRTYHVRTMTEAVITVIDDRIYLHNEDKAIKLLYLRLSVSLNLKRTKK